MDRFLSVPEVYRIVPNSQSYIIDKDCNILGGNGKIHVELIVEHLDLVEEMDETIRYDYCVELLENGTTTCVLDYFIDEMIQDYNIFEFIVNNNTSIITVRPHLNGKRPSRKQMKELKDWAIEQGLDENILFDYVSA